MSLTYVRFVVAVRDPTASHPLGIFQVARYLRDAEQFTRAELAEADAIMAWMGEHVASPPGRLWRRRRPPVSWFRATARGALARAQAMALLLARCGLPVATVVTCAPGTVLYADRHQVLALPGAPPDGQTWPEWPPTTLRRLTLR